VRARRLRAGWLYVLRDDFHPVAIGIAANGDWSWKKKPLALAVDVVSAVGSQRDGAAEAVGVAAVVTTMHSGGHGKITQQACE
jgi:hypothetical protein